MIMTVLLSTVAIQCALQTEGKSPPMIVTLNDETQSVQVTMAGQSYTSDFIKDGPVVWWQVKGADEVTIMSRLNRADGTITIANSGSELLVKGNCAPARRRF